LYKSGNLFLDEIERVSKIFKVIIKNKHVKIISQFDTDGITSAAILTKMLLRENVNFDLRIVKQLTRDVVAELNVDENDFVIISDCGSGQLPTLKEMIDKTEFLILDHHEPADFTHMNLLHINPLLFGEDEMSASIVCYLFAKFVNVKNVDLVDLAIIGAIGDMADENWEFKGLIKKITDEAETIGKVTTTKGLRLYGRFSRPIYKSLAYSFNPFIPGISGNESQAIQFLSDLDINVKEHDEWKKLKDLSVEEQQKLATAIIVQRLKSEKDAADIFGDNFTILDRPEELQDVREFATLINACGRTNNHNIALRLLVGDYMVLDKSRDVLDGYKKLISNSLKWIREHQKSISNSNFATFLLAENKIPESVIGTVTTIILN